MRRRTSSANGLTANGWLCQQMDCRQTEFPGSDCSQRPPGSVIHSVCNCHLSTVSTICREAICRHSRPVALRSFIRSLCVRVLHQTQPHFEFRHRFGRCGRRSAAEPRGRRHCVSASVTQFRQGTYCPCRVQCRSLHPGHRRQFLFASCC